MNKIVKGHGCSRAEVIKDIYYTIKPSDGEFLIRAKDVDTTIMVEYEYQAIEHLYDYIVEEFIFIKDKTEEHLHPGALRKRDMLLEHLSAK